MCIPSRTANQRGFTLIELMITVGVIAVLTAIAYPSYTDYVIRGKIPDALSTLAAKRVQLEQSFQDNHTYVDPDAKACDDNTETSHYFDFSCTDPTQTAYTLQAVGKDSMDGFTFTVDEANHKATTDVPPGWSFT